jgi:hypothetical protein
MVGFTSSEAAAHIPSEFSDVCKPHHLAK